MPVWRPAGSYAHGARFPGHGTSKPHGQTVQELRTFDVPCMRFHTRSPRQADSYSNLLHRASALRIGVSAEASSSSCTPQVAAVRLSASPSGALHSSDCMLASPSGGAPRCIFRCAASTHAALHKLRRIARLNKHRARQSLFRVAASTRSALGGAIPSHAASTNVALHRQLIPLPLQRDVRSRCMRSILTKKQARRPGTSSFSGTQPKLEPVIAVRVDGLAADAAAEAAHLHSCHIAGIRRGYRSRRTCTTFRSNTTSSRMVFRPVHGRPHAAQSFQSRQGTVPSGTEPIIPLDGTHVKQ